MRLIKGVWAAVGLGAVLSVGAVRASSNHQAMADTVLDCVQPHLAAAEGEVVLACGRAGTVLISRSVDGGRTFAPLKTIATVPELPLGRRRGPRIAADGDTLIVSAVVGRAQKPRSTGDLMVWRSSDHGTSWTGPVRINSEPDAAREGLHALAARGGRFVAVWLDLRQHGTTLYASESRDGGRQWGPERRLYVSPSGSICECCQPSVALGAAGAPLAMFRNNIGGNRDMYVVDDRGRAAKLGHGSWQMSACPMDGGGIARGDGDGVLTVWRREQTIYVASPDGTEQPLGDGHDGAVAAHRSSYAVAWVAPTGLVLAGDYRARPVPVDGQGTFPTLTSSRRGGGVLAWQHGNETHVRTFAAR
jgi:hypothetical protein